MNEAVFVPSIAMWASVLTIAVIGLAGGALLYVCENIAAKRRPSH